MTRLNLAMHGPEKAINFAQGFPDFDPPQELIQAAQRALTDGYNQDATTWGAPALRQAIESKVGKLAFFGERLEFFGLVVRGEDPFRGRDPDFRAIPGTTKPNDPLSSHISINFDRTGFQEDWNVIFPLDRLNELATEGTIGSVAATHYSFMGATDPIQMEPYARELAGRLKADAVDAVILPPV